VCVCVCVTYKYLFVLNQMLPSAVCFQTLVYMVMLVYEHTLTEMVQVLYTTCDGNDISHFLGKSLGPAKC